ncbi:MAG: HAD family hydrolase [Planctomycetota bacterium]
MFKVIIIDLDGPILDGMLRHYQCYSDILSENGYCPVPSQKYWSMKRNRYSHAEQLAESGAEGISNLFVERWLTLVEERRYLRLDRVQDGIINRLRQWKSRDIKIILVTMRNNNSNLYWQLEQFGLLALFDHIIVISSKSTGIDKADMVELHIKDMNRNCILWIGDTEADINAARKLGVMVAAVGCGVRSSDFLLSLNPDFFFADVESIELNNGGK